jgi:hypothetical protein
VGAVIDGKLAYFDRDHEAILMRLDEQERFAMTQLFAEPNAFCAAIREGLQTAEVIERWSTRVGFFSWVKFRQSLPHTVSLRQWDWSFSHRELTHGGSFIAWRQSSDTIGLEAVSHHEDWPKKFDPSDFEAAPGR